MVRERDPIFPGKNNNTPQILLRAGQVKIMSMFLLNYVFETLFKIISEEGLKG